MPLPGLAFRLRMTALYFVAVRIEGLDLKFADLTILTFDDSIVE